MTQGYAYALLIYKKNKSIPEYVLFDKDSNKTLESKVASKEFRTKEKRGCKQLNKKDSFNYI